MNRVRPFVAFVAFVSFSFVVLCPLSVSAQRSDRQVREDSCPEGDFACLERKARRYQRVTEDPRGLNRYTLTGETAPLSIFTLPAYNGRDSEFFDGYGRMTAEELGLEGAEFWNEFGRSARKGRLTGKAVIWFPNGFDWDEAYLEGCTKAGKRYFNRIKILKKPVVKPNIPQKELCVNIPLAVEDVPSDWTVTRRSDGRRECHYPVPEPIQLPAPPPIDNTCVPGAVVQIFSYSEERKGFIAADIIRQKEVDPKKSALIINNLASGNNLVTSIVVMTDGCNIGVSTHSVKYKKSWVKWWMIPAAFAGGFLLGYFIHGGGCKNCTNPSKVVTSGSSEPGRPRRYDEE